MNIEIVKNEIVKNNIFAKIFLLSKIIMYFYVPKPHYMKYLQEKNNLYCLKFR